MYCQVCGKMISDTAAFCRFCGNKVARSQGRAQSSSADMQNQNAPMGNQRAANTYEPQGQPYNSNSGIRSGQPYNPNDGIRSGQPYNPNNGIRSGQPYNPNIGIQSGQPYNPNTGMQRGQPHNPNTGMQSGQPYSQNAGMYGGQPYNQNTLGNGSQPYGSNQGMYSYRPPVQPPLYGAAQMAGGAVRGGAKAAGEAAKIKVLALIAAVLVALAVMVYFLFFKAGTPEDTIAKMEDALNHLDQEALLECFDGQTQQLYSGALGLSEELSGLPLGDFSDFAAGLGGFMAGAGLTPEYTLSIVEVEYSDSENCMVTVDMSVDFQGETESETQMFPMTKDGRDWVISAAAMQDMF
ncbi:MAG: hypothetical protein KH828_02230 [Clostridiales bacterium]|nr:hypothetical protein [Clostridiales bacterium]